MEVEMLSPRIMLCSSKKRKKFYVHRIIGCYISFYFIFLPEKYKNKIDNLYIDTISYEKIQSSIKKLRKLKPVPISEYTIMYGTAGIVLDQSAYLLFESEIEYHKFKLKL